MEEMTLDTAAQEDSLEVKPCSDLRNSLLKIQRIQTFRIESFKLKAFYEPWQSNLLYCTLRSPYERTLTFHLRNS